jgi:hypothetical protein
MWVFLNDSAVFLVMIQEIFCAPKSIYPSCEEIDQRI